VTIWCFEVERVGCENSRFVQYLNTDGTIQYEAKLTGILSTSIMSEGEGRLPQHGALMSEGLNAQIHQHFFCVRMDPAIDCEEGGKALTVSEVNRPNSCNEQDE